MRPCICAAKLNGLGQPEMPPTPTLVSGVVPSSSTNRAPPYAMSMVRSLSSAAARRANVSGSIDRAPGAHVYVDYKADWYEIGDSLPRYGETTGVERKQ